jgi:ParB family chromosome partitioning protein
MKIEINKIKIVPRIRKEVSKIEELAENIREHGLISPIAVMPLDGGEYQLLAGLRRVRAMELNAEPQIEAKIFPMSDAEEALNIEYSENEQREQFVFSEKMDYAKLIEEIESVKAKERMSEGGNEIGRGRLKTEKVGMDCGPYPISGSRRDIIGEKIGMSGKQYDRAKYIVENASPEIIEQIDRGKKTITAVYNQLRGKTKSKKASPPKNIILQTKPVTEPAPQTDIAAQTQTENPEPVNSSVQTEKDTPIPEKFHVMDSESIRKNEEYDALSPEGKIEELQNQLKKERTRAATAESKLERETELRKNAENHFGATIEMQKKQLEEAYMRISELEKKYEPDSQNSWEMPESICMLKNIS